MPNRELGYGGPCFPRDNLALNYFARILGTRAHLAEATDLANRSLPGDIIRRLGGLVHSGTTVTVLGLAYKPLTNVIEQSQGIHIVKSLAKGGARVVAYDPLASAPARVELENDALVLDSASACIEQAEVVMITTPDPCFKALSASDFTGKTVIDFWRILAEVLADQASVRYFAVGRGMADCVVNSGGLEFWDEVTEPH